MSITIDINSITENGWIMYCKNKYVLPFLEKHVEYLTEKCWEVLCKQKNTLPFLEKHVKLIPSKCWEILCENENKCVIRFLDKHFSDVYLTEQSSYNCLLKLCLNKNAIPIIKSFSYYDDRGCYNTVPSLLEPEHWENLCKNENAIFIIKDNVNYLTTAKCWINLCQNINGLDIIHDNIDKIIITDDFLINLCNNQYGYAITYIIERIFENYTIENPNILHYLCFYYLNIYENENEKNIIKKIIEKNINKLPECWKSLFK